MGFINYPVGDVGSTPALGGVGLALVASQAFSAAASVSLNGCFTSTYENYRIIYDLTSSVSTTIQYRLRASGSDNITSNYGRQSLGGNNTSVTAFAATAALWYTTGANSVNVDYGVIEMLAPQLATYTKAISLCRDGGPNMVLIGGYFGATTQFDGFTIYPASGTITGTVAVYGYQRA